MTRATLTSSTVPRTLDTFELGVAQMLKCPSLGWDKLSAAQWYIDHPYKLDTGGRYGLGFAARLVMKLDPSALSFWVAEAPERPALAAVARAGLDVLLEDQEQGVDLLLRSGNALFKAMAAAFLALTENGSGPRFTYGEVHQRLVRGGITPSDAIWLAGLQLKQVVHSRYRVRHRNEQQTSRLRNLRIHPNDAVGGAEYAADEIVYLEREVDQLTAREVACEAALERTLSEVAESWPACGLDERHMKCLAPVFVDTPEIKHRLAAKLPHSANCDALLKQNLDSIAKDIGLVANPEPLFDRYFSADRPRFFEQACWCARSLLALYAKDMKGAGHRTGQRIGPLAKAAASILKEPFIASRQPDRWESAAARSVAANIFALFVVAETPADRLGEVEILRNHAIDHALDLMRFAGDRIIGRHMTDDLARLAVMHAGLERLKVWIDSEYLPPLIRAFAVWSRPDLVKVDLERARTLFIQAAQVPISRRTEAHHFGQLLSLLDSAITAAFSAEAFDLTSELITLWDEVAPDWAAHLGSRWSDAAGMFERALTKQGADRDYILADPTFRNSCCRALLVSLPEVRCGNR